MNISEIETRTGLTRANVRFYEKEQLLAPVRKNNGYRDYSEDDIQTLLKIKLLRELGVSLNAIRSLQENPRQLLQVLETCLSDIHTESDRLRSASLICQAISASGASYDTLDAARYLDEFEKQTEKKTALAVKKDVLATEPHPWRRYAARGLDSLLATLFFFFLYYIVLHHKPAADLGFSILTVIAVLLLTLAIEPILISRCGTTPGKWLMGISIFDVEEGRLSYKNALMRTLGVLWYGAGFSIPFYSLYRKLRCFFTYTRQKEETLPWDDGISYHFRDLRALHVLDTVFLLLFCCGAGLQIYRYAELPRHKGDITLEEFAENYNDYRKYYELPNSQQYHLDKNGQWQNLSGADGGREDFSSNVLTEAFPLPDYHYTEENGLLTGISFEMKYRGAKCFAGYPEEIRSAVLSYAGAQETFNIWNRNLERLLLYLEDHTKDVPGSFQFTEDEITVICRIDSDGYEYFAGMLIPSGSLNPDTPDAEGSFRISFSMTRK